MMKHGDEVAGARPYIEDTATWADERQQILNRMCVLPTPVSFESRYPMVPLHTMCGAEMVAS